VSTGVQGERTYGCAPLSRPCDTVETMTDVARFRDLFDPTVPRVNRSVRRERLNLCEGCDNYSKTLRTCGVCGCVMPLKTTLAHAECPIGLWKAEAPHAE